MLKLEMLSNTKTSAIVERNLIVIVVRSKNGDEIGRMPSVPSFHKLVI